MSCLLALDSPAIYDGRKEQMRIAAHLIMMKLNRILADSMRE
jgi:hypothetical protein